MGIAWASEAAKTVGTLVEPAWTWNVVVTVAVGLMVWNLKRTIAKADELKEKLITNAIASLEKSITDWQAGAKERTASLCKKIDDLREDIKQRVHITHCNERHTTMRDEILEIKHRLHT